jgi:hypothetical protein
MTTPTHTTVSQLIAERVEQTLTGGISSVQCNIRMSSVNQNSSAAVLLAAPA